MVDPRFQIIFPVPSADLSTTLMAAAGTPLTLAGSSQSTCPSQVQLSNQPRRSRRSSSSSNSSKVPPSCHHSSVPALIDVAVLIVVLFACGYLALPCFQLLYHGVKVAFCTAKNDLDPVSIAFMCVGMGFPVLGVAAFMIIRCTADCRKCDNPNCMGLRDAHEFDVQIETEEMCMKNSSTSSTGGDNMDGGFFELTGDHHRELEAKLKKVAPPNGRAILIFRARCGCSAGRMVVWGPKKIRKTKK